MATEERRRERLDRGIKVRTEGLYALMSWREMTYLLLPRTVFVLGLLVLPLAIQNMYWQRVICMMGVFALLALVFDFLAEHVGLVLIGGAFMVGVGGYFSGALNWYLGIPPILSIPIGTVAGALLCTLVWLPTLPLRGIYFAIVSFMFPFLARAIILAFGLAGSTEGLSPIAPFPNIYFEQYLVIAVVLIATFGLRRLMGEDIGLVLRGVKDNEMAVMASGISLTRMKVLAVFIASLIGCFAGAYVAHLYQFTGLSLFGLDFSILPIAACVLGGPGSLIGPVLGAILLTPLSELLREFGQLRVVLYAAILIGFVLFRPEGLFNWVVRLYHQFEHWRKV